MQLDAGGPVAPRGRTQRTVAERHHIYAVFLEVSRLPHESGGQYQWSAPEQLQLLRAVLLEGSPLPQEGGRHQRESAPKSRMIRRRLPGHKPRRATGNSAAAVRLPPLRLRVAA
jgi:hypothetical protein